MKKIISIVLAVLLLFGSGGALTYSALNSFFDYTPPSGDGGGTESGDGGTEQTPPTVTEPILTVPAYKDYGRGTVDFSSIVYARPDIDSAVEDFSALCDRIEANTESFEEQLLAIRELDDIFFEISSMYTYANIMAKKDSTSTEWNTEFAYVSMNYPKLAQAVEELFVACARSTHNERFENEYFGEDLIEDYQDGGSYSDALVELMAAEAELEAEYSEINTATLELTYGGITGTADFLVAYYYDKFGKNPVTENTYLYHIMMINTLYYEAYAEKTEPIFINLLKTRSLIKDELGLTSYMEYSYDGFGHDYTSDDMMQLLSDVAEYVMPLYYKLYTEIFRSYEAPMKIGELHKNEILNTLYTVFEDTDRELFEAFCYMLQHGLYDIEKSSSERYSGAFTTYIDKYEAPFIFVSTVGDVDDYFTVVHEFGHFFDSYVNYGADSSLDLSEISSQALELLVIETLGDTLGKQMADYLLIHQIDSFLGTIRSQSLYSMIEHKIYELSYGDITAESINAIIAECEEKFYYPAGTFDIGSIVTVPHIVLYPNYVQSYTTSALVSLEIYFTEIDGEGEGLAAYKELISRDENSSFEADLEATGLVSPFEESFVKTTVNRIHRLIYGSDYYKDGTLPNAA